MKAMSDFLISLGGPVLLVLVLFLLGMCFGAGFKKSVRSAFYGAGGLSGLFVVTDAAVAAMTPAITAFAERFGRTAIVTDVGWASTGAAFAWPGLGIVMIATLAVNLLLIFLKVVKTAWTDIWSMWHGNALASLVWAMTGGNITLGVLAGVLFLTVNTFVADFSAKKYQEFYQMPGISVPCCVTLTALAAAPFNMLIEKIPGLRDIDWSPETIRKRMGVFGDMGVMGFLIGALIGVLGGLSFAGVMSLGIQICMMMIFLPKTVSVMCEGIIPIANSVTEFVQEHFAGREIYVAVDCAVTLGHPSVMAAACITYPLTVALAMVLPGCAIIPIASLPLIPYLLGGCASYLKGNVFRMVLFILLWLIPVMLIATAQAPIHTLAMGQLNLADPNVINSSFDIGGDPLGWVIINIFKLFV